MTRRLAVLPVVALALRAFVFGALVFQALVLQSLAVPAPAMAALRAQTPSASPLSAAAAAEVNRLRAASGLGRVAADAALTRAAEAHARAMRDARTMSHDVGGRFSARIAAAGIRTTNAAENIAAGQRSLAEAMASWAASSGHRANMLARPMTRIGVARAEGAGGPFWAMILAAPEPPARRAGEGPTGGSGVIFFGLPVPLSP